MKVDSATATLLGTVLGAMISQAANVINGFFGDRKARRELMYKTAFDYLEDSIPGSRGSKP
jgi:hypothetical protein